MLSLTFKTGCLKTAMEL